MLVPSRQPELFSPGLTAKAKHTLRSSEHELVVSLWETAIKIKTGKLNTHREACSAIKRFDSSAEESSAGEASHAQHARTQQHDAGGFRSHGSTGESEVWPE